MKIPPKTRWNLARILPFGVIWVVLGLVFIVSDKLAMADNPVPQGAIDPNGQVILFACIATFLMGLLVGTMEVIWVNRWFRKASLLQTILGKFLFYASVFTLVIAVVYPMAASIDMGVGMHEDAVKTRSMQFWGSYAFYSTGLQLSFSLLVSVLYAAISENLGHGVLVNLFTGKYHTPKQEVRIFLFIDMYDSTSIAEALGHIKYFSFLRDYYNDLADAIIRHEGEVYQYVGDEIVLTWPLDKGLRNSNCLAVFFAMQAALQAREERYKKTYGYVPRFKGGMHLGVVTTGEVGGLKKRSRLHGRCA